MTTSEPFQQTLFDETELPLTQSVAGSPAKTLAMLESALALKVKGLVCGESTGDLLARYDPASSSWRTCQACLVSGWEPFSETFPRSGMMLSGTVYQLPPSVLLTGGTGSGSWPTPRANDAEKRGEIDATNPRNGLPDAVKMWPTPQAGDCKARGTQNATARLMAIGKLEAFVKYWPTPTTRDWKDGSAQACRNVPANGLLGRVVHQWPPPRAQSARGSGPSRTGNKADLQTVVGGSLNADWVEWLMGFPTGWTVVTGWKSQKASRASPEAKKTEPAD